MKSGVPGTTNSAIHLLGGTLGTIPTGQQTLRRLSASRGKPPYTYHFSTSYQHPSWVTLSTGGTLTISPPANDHAAYTLHVYVADATGEHSPLDRDAVTFQTNGAGGGGGSGSAISAGGGDSCALLQGGGVDCWGDNEHGQLGDGTSTGPESCFVGAFVVPCSMTPVTVSGLTHAIAVSAADWHSCALLQGGGVDCWGDNFYGELGDGTQMSSSTPVAVSGLTNATAISAGSGHSCALLQGGGVDRWGSNSYGELGDGTTTDRSTTPVAVSGLTNAIAVSAGGEYSCALLGRQPRR